MDVNIEELLSSKRGLSEEEFNENPELAHLVDNFGFDVLRGKIFIADDWYILDQVTLGSRVNKITTPYFSNPSYDSINFIDYIKNAKTKILFDSCTLNCSPVADTVVEINTDIVFNNCIGTSTNVKAIHGYIFKKEVYLNNSNINFTDCTFEDDFKCENANFDVDFSQSKFLRNFTFHLLQSRNINFEGALFYANASFKVIQKIESANFYQANFKNTVSFSPIQFGDGLVDFSETKFDKAVSFYRCTFDGKTKFNGAIFGGIAKFTRVTFNNAVNFDKANFKNESRFCRTATLAETTFENKADFSNVVFNNKADFTNAVFEADTDFSSATFTDEARFLNAKFKDTTTFEKANFKSEANFTDTVFEKETKLNNILFNDKVYFQDALFKDIVDFGETNFEKNAYFYNADFKNLTNFASSVFDGTLNFTNVKTNFTYLTYEELKNIIKDKSTNDMYPKNHKINHIDKCINITNDFRDGFRLIKHTLNDKGNALDASLYRCLELYCKELELEFTLKKTKDKKSKNNKEVESADKVEAKPKSENRIEILLDLMTLKLYRSTSDHHTNLLRIINFMALTIAVYGLCFYIFDIFLLETIVANPKALVFSIILCYIVGLIAYMANLSIKQSAVAVIATIICVFYGIGKYYPIFTIYFIFLYLTLYFVFFYLHEFILAKILTYLICIFIFLSKPFLIAPFIGVFTSEQAAQSKFKEYTVRYNENGLDDMLLDANLTNTKKDNKLDFIVENRKTILEELDCDKTLLIKSKNKCAQNTDETVYSNLNNKIKKPYAKALAALKYDEIMQSTQKSANLLYGFIMLLVVYSLTKTARKNSVVPS